MTKSCIIHHWVENWESYVHVRDKTWVKTKKELLEVCGCCSEYLTCKNIEKLLILLSINDAPKTR